MFKIVLLNAKDHSNTAQFSELSLYQYSSVTDTRLYGTSCTYTGPEHQLKLCQMTAQQVFGLLDVPSLTWPEASDGIGGGSPPCLSAHPSAVPMDVGRASLVQELCGYTL